MNILLIIPPYPIEEYPALSTGTVYLAAVLREEGHRVEILDLLLSEATRRKVHDAVKSASPHVVGITSVTMTFPMACRILKWVHELEPHLPTLMGGPHVTFAPERSLRECPAADIVVRGEAESTLLELLHVLDIGGDLAQVDGITFRNGKEIISTPNRPLIEDLDALPQPAWDLLPLARYRALGAKVGVLSSRGCPYGCIFCVGHRMVGRRPRLRSPDRVVDEMAWLAGVGFKEIGVDDDLFTLHHPHAMEVCEEILARRLPASWHAFARVDTVTPELLEKMARSGCTDICYGVESGSQEILDRIGKGITLEQVHRAVDMGKRAGIRILASFILGLPGETKETLRQTAAFARSLGCRFGFHILAPFPGTRVRQQAKAYSLRILTDRWDLYDANRPVALPEGIEVEDILAVTRRYEQELDDYCRSQRKRVERGEGSAEDEEEVRLRAHREIAWKILKEDLIEKHAPRIAGPSREIAFRGLFDGLNSHLPCPGDWVEDVLRSWVKEGLLRVERQGSLWRWRWAETWEILGGSREERSATPRS